MTEELVGRAGELAAIESFLDALADGPSALVLEGEPGIGKTALLSAVHDAATRRELGLLTCAASASDTRPAYDALAELFSDLGEDELAGLPGPQRAALERALLLGDAGAADTDPRAVATAALTTFEQLAADQPLVVSIDDLQWVDQPSARVIGFCARRLRSGVGLVVSRRASDEQAERPGALELREPERVHVRRLAPLEARSLRSLIRQRSERPLSRRTIERIQEASGGNPLYALELARAVPRDGPLPALPTPPTLQQVVARRLDGVDGDLEEVLLGVALLARPSGELVSQAVGSGAESLLDDAEERGILVRDGPRVRFTHELLADAVRARTSADRRREMHRRLSGVVPGIEARARHLANAQVLPDAIAELVEAARHARARGGAAAAAELLELALELGAGSDLRVQAAGHYADAGDAAHAQALLTEAIALLPRGNARARAQLMLAEIRYHDDSYPEARGLLEEAEAEPGVGRRLRVMIALRLAFVLCNLGLVGEAERPARAALAGADALGDDALRAQALSLTATVDFALGRGVNEARLSRALTLEISDVRTDRVLRPSLITALLYLWTGRLDESRLLLTGLCDRHADRGEEHELAWACCALVWLECWSGNLVSATGALDRAVDHIEQLETRNGRALALSARALVDAYAGRDYEARRSAEEALALFQLSGWQTAAWRPRATLGFLDLSLENYEAAANRLGPAALAAASNGLAAPVTWGGALSYGDAAEALVGVGRIEEAETIVPLLERRGSALGGAWPRGLGARCRGLMLAARGDLSAAEEMLEHSVAAHRQLPVPIERARGLLLLGRVQRRRRKLLAARDALEQALATFEAIGSPLWAEQARAELRALTAAR